MYTKKGLFIIRLPLNLHPIDHSLTFFTAPVRIPSTLSRIIKSTCIHEAVWEGRVAAVAVVVEHVVRSSRRLSAFPIELNS